MNGGVYNVFEKNIIIRKRKNGKHNKYITYQYCASNNLGVQFIGFQSFFESRFPNFLFL